MPLRSSPNIDGLLALTGIASAEPAAKSPVLHCSVKAKTKPAAARLPKSKRPSKPQAPQAKSTTTMDPTFYRTPADAMAAPAEQLAYVAGFDPAHKHEDAVFVVDLDRASATYGRAVHKTNVPAGSELHHFGWNACSSALKHCGHGHGPAAASLQRRYLIVPGLRSSDIFVLDTAPDPRAPVLVKTVAAAELADRAGYSRPHTVHCGPAGVFVTCLGGSDRGRGGGEGATDDGKAEGQEAEEEKEAKEAAGQPLPGGIALLDHDTFDVLRAWETARGPQRFHYDAWWHLNRNTLVSSEWGAPSMIEAGLVPELLLANRYGHALHFWDLREGRHVQRVELGEEHQMVLEVRPSHDPEATWGYVGVVVSTKDLSGSVWRWYLDEGKEDEGKKWKVEKVITIPAQKVEDASKLPPLLQPFGGPVPPIITDIDLSVDDRYLYVSCWVTGELKQYDVSDPKHPKETGSVRLGGVIDPSAHPSRPNEPLGGGPQMVEVSRDGRRIYLTNSLYSSWDDQFYPDGVGAWMVKVDVLPGGGMEVDKDFFLGADAFEGLRVHQIRLQGGDASTDSYCYRSEVRANA
ncbi:selenium-binding protein [Diplodia corticola]|uniref:Selenium-binding protein n=1 Tax=Diplodia corticola TaxID=236234 RepID=A0A1J9R601_9PEZI|nr:selenium-binding protein [Diplodia corticola]OJD35977.1 selenium-binding protein [Diplodia corticola]